MKLTRRQAEVLQLIYEGKSSQEVAEILFVAPRTIDFHLVNIYARLGVRNRIQAFREAMRLGIIRPPARRDRSPEPVIKERYAR